MAFGVLSLVAPEDLSVANQADLSSHVGVELALRVSDELEVLLLAIVDVHDVSGSLPSR